MSSQYVGQLMLAGFNFPPVGWATASGQLMSIAQNTALFSLLGTYYGGDGRSTFGLPNMQGNVPVGMGQGAGLNPHFIGETGGSQNVTLLQTEVPLHTHAVQGAGGRANENSPVGNSLADAKQAPGNFYSNATTPLVNMAVSAVSTYGGSQPHNNLMPYLALNWVIALQGIFPPRS